MGVADFRAAASAILDRMRFARQNGLSHNGARNYYEVFGYDELVTTWQYRQEYARGGIAKRIVEAFPKATWRGGVELYEDEDPEASTPFEVAWRGLEERLNVWSVLQRADILAGLSTYSAILIGAAGTNFEEELPRGSSPDQVLYLTPFFGGGGPGMNLRGRALAQDADCTIATFDDNAKSPRFGDPQTYNLKRTYMVAPALQRPVHWSRIIHIAEGCLEDNVYGVPTLENVWNLLMDLMKVTGGGAEAFWLRANAGVQFDIDKDMATPPSTDELDSLKQQAEDYRHQLTRMMRTRGVNINQLGSDVANFGPPADAILKQIAGSKGIPMRILTGSEMGTLASEQDAANFDSQVQDRRTGHAGPLIVRKLVDRLIDYGYLPKPKAYTVGWPVEENMDEIGKAALAKAMAEVNSVQQSVVFTEEEIREKCFDLEPLKDSVASDSLSELQKAEVATKLALTNKEMGITVFTDDEIRKITYGLAPLSDTEKVPIGAPERISVTAPPQLGADGQPVAQPAQSAAGPAAVPALKAAEDDELLRVLTAAIEADNEEVISAIVGVTHGA